MIEVFRVNGEQGEWRLGWGVSVFGEGGRGPNVMDLRGRKDRKYQKLESKTQH